MKFINKKSNADEIKMAIVRRTSRRASLPSNKVSNSSTMISHADLADVVLKNADIVSIKRGLSIRGFSHNRQAKLVKKALSDAENAMIRASVLESSDRACSYVATRVRGWCEKIDPLKDQKKTKLTR